MNEYEVFRRDVDGIETRVEKFTKFSATLRMNEIGKWRLDGRGDRSLFQAGDGISVLRNGELFLSGAATEVSEEFDERYPDYSLVIWSVEGVDDNGLIHRRSVVPDPVQLDFSAASHQVITDYGGNAILRFIDSHGGDAANTGRRIPNFSVDSAKDYGILDTFRGRFQNVWEFVTEIAAEQGLRVYVLRNKQGEYTATVGVPADRSGTVIFSREFGTLKKWTRRVCAPKANAVWVVGQGELTERMVSYREDPASIARWGRIEVIKDRRDISDQAVADDPRTPQERLDEAAEAFLSESVAGDSYELELAPIERLQFRRDWDLGDIVTIRIGNEAIQAAISEVKIDYAAGIETVKPSVGTISRGTLGKTYGEIRDIRQRLEVLERI